MRVMLGCGLLAMVFAAAAAGADAPAAPAPCRLISLGSVPMEMDGTGRITVPVTFNGVEKRIMVDTGATASAITAATATELKLPAEEMRNRGSVVMWGGNKASRIATVNEFGIAGMKGKDFLFFVINRYVESAGLLGGDIFRSYDVDLDFANAKFTMFSADHCPGQVVYWTRGPYAAVPFEVNDNHIAVKLKLDGKNVKAILDTGAPDTDMSLEKAAWEFDLDKKLLAKSRHYPFNTLSLGGINVANPAIELVPDRESVLMGQYTDDINMILGMGILRRLHLYISYKEKMIYVTPATQY